MFETSIIELQSKSSETHLCLYAQCNSRWLY